MAINILKVNRCANNNYIYNLLNIDLFPFILYLCRSEQFAKAYWGCCVANNPLFPLTTWNALDSGTLRVSWDRHGTRRASLMSPFYCLFSVRHALPCTCACERRTIKD